MNKLSIDGTKTIPESQGQRVMTGLISREMERLARKEVRILSTIARKKGPAAVFGLGAEYLELHALYPTEEAFNFPGYLNWAMRNGVLENRMEHALDNVTQRTMGKKTGNCTPPLLLTSRTKLKRLFWNRTASREKRPERTSSCNHTVRRRRPAAAGCRRALDQGGGMGEPSDPDSDPEPHSPAARRGAPEPVHVGYYVKKILEKLKANKTAKLRAEGI